MKIKPGRTSCSWTQKRLEQSRAPVNRESGKRAGHIEPRRQTALGKVASIDDRYTERTIPAVQFQQQITES